MSAVLGIDVGTGSTKASLIDYDGRHLRSAEASYAVRHGATPSDVDPDVWWEAAVEAVRAVVADSDDIAGVGVTGQMHGVVLCDEGGEPLRPAITWTDSRANAQAAVFQSLPEDVLRSLGNPISPGMAGPLLLWLADHEPAIYGKARWALQPKDWLRMRMTGRAATDPSDASATLLYDITSDDWSHPTLRLLGLNDELLAEVQASASISGELSSQAASELGLMPGLPVAVGAGDAAAALASTAVGAGETLVNVGSGAQVLTPTQTPKAHPDRLTNVYRGARSPWYAMAAVQNAGVALEWVLRALQSSWQEVYEVALPETAPGSGGVHFLPHLLEERYPTSVSSGAAWVGLRSCHDRRYLLRAAVEGVAFAIRHANDLLADLGTRSDAYWLSGGSARWPGWQQLLADVLGHELLVLPTESRSARGAALLAAEALEIEIVIGNPRAGHVTPNAERVAIYDATFREHRLIDAQASNCTNVGHQ